jgi:ribosomal protein S18 acetylase RimI-like enzyme
MFGRVVSIVAIVEGGGALGVYSLATMPGDRRHGYGEALLRGALERESARTGVTRVILQSTEAGQGLYERLGFHEVAQFSVYLTR